jgi:two-component system response regulator RstA
MVVLDVMLPGADGLTICREVRPHYHQPILMLTARTEDMDQVLGLEMGADDYVAKPVQPRVLLARIRALLRRTDKAPEDEVAQRIEFDDLVIDNGGRSVTLNGELVDFTSAEYDLLWLLASNAGRILSREDIFERLRGIEYDGQDRSIDVRISRIRPKIGDDPENPKRDFITVIQFPFCMILRNVNHHIYFFIPQVVHNIRFFLFVGPMKDGDTNTVFLKELSRACCCKNMISFGNEHFCRIE